MEGIDRENSSTENAQIRYARLAGFMYLFVIVAYLLGMFMISRFGVSGNFNGTVHGAVGSELLHRIGLSCGLIGSLCTVFLAMGLYRAVKPIDDNLALLAMVFRLVEATLGGIQSILGFVVLKLNVGAGSVTAFDANQRSVLVGLSSAQNSAAFNVSAAFFGMGSILFFYLFLKRRRTFCDLTT